MIVKGIVTCVLRDVVTGEVTRSFTVENNVTDYQLSRMTIVGAYTAAGAQFGPNIVISGDVISPSRSAYISNVHAAGVVESGVTSPQYFYPVADAGSPPLKTPPYIQYQQRFSPPASNIVINKIGLTADTPTSVNVVNYKISLCHAWVDLSPACSQSTTETLDVFYRIQFLYGHDLQDPKDANPLSTDTSLDKMSAGKAAVWHRDTGNIHDYFYGAHMLWYGSKVNSRFTSTALTMSDDDLTYRYDSPMTFSRSQFFTIPKAQFNLDYTIDIKVGKVIGSIGYGQDKIASASVHDIRPLFPDGENPIQTAFGHSAAATKPFYDSTTTQSGTGTMALDGSTWTDPNWPKLYRIDVVSGGATGTATYRLKMRNHFGFYLNAYQDQERDLTHTNQNNSVASWEGFDIGFISIAYEKHPLSNSKCVAINPTELCVMDMTTQTGKRTHVSLQPTFTPTKIGRIEIEQDTSDIWVPCLETGLYKIVDPEGSRTITKFTLPATLDRCLTVAITPVPGTGGVGKRVWALFSDATGDRIVNTAVGLYYSDNDGGTWAQDNTWDPTVFAYWTTYVTNGRVNDIRFMTSDRNHPDGRLLFGGSRYTLAVSPSSDYVPSMWHDGISGSSAGHAEIARGYTSVANIRYAAMGLLDPRTLGRLYDASPNQGQWGGRYFVNANPYCKYLDYGTTSQHAPSVVTSHGYNLGWTLDDEGNDSLIFATGNTTSAFLGVFKKNTLTTETEQISSVTTNTFSTAGATFYGALLHLGNGVFLGRSGLTSTSQGQLGIATLSTLGAPLGHTQHGLNVWTDYGWDGASWVADHIGNKTTHTGAETLVDGVTIAFADAAANPGSTGNWIATDYYTFGVLDGIWLDGSTEFNHKLPLYMKPTTIGNIEIESATLPGTTRTLDYFTSHAGLTWQNDSGNILLANNGLNMLANVSFVLDSWAGFAQSNESLPLANVGDLTNPRADVHASFSWQPRYTSYYTYISTQYVAGISSQTRINNVASYTAQRQNSPEFAIMLAPASNFTRYYNDIYIVHGGVIQESFINLNTSGLTSFNIEVMKDGHVRYSYMNTSVTPNTIVYLYDTHNAGSPIVPPITLPHENYYIDYATSGTSIYGALDNIELSYVSAPGYYIRLGNEAGARGYWNPEFYSFDYTHDFSVLIAGVEATSIGPDDTATPLTAGQYSPLHHMAAIRYSADDIGKSISVVYNESTNI